MKHYIYVLLLLFVQNMQAADTKLPDNEIDQIITQLINEIKTIRKEYDLKKSFYYNRLQQISSELTTAKDLESKVDLLIKKDAIQNQLHYLARAEQNNIQKIRYLKGLSVIKLLYEKVLGLDHHFSSLVTFNEINKISNPNNYPEFEKVKDIIKQKTDKKKRLPLTGLLGQNMYTATIDMFIGLFSADASSTEKKEELENVQCILDFTLRMNNDLKTIYFETTFLQKSNEKIKQDLEILFKSYTKPIGYFTGLQECRMNDDWDTVREKLNVYIDRMEKLSKNNDNPLKYRKMIIDLNFPR